MNVLDFLIMFGSGNGSCNTMNILQHRARGFVMLAVLMATPASMVVAETAVDPEWRYTVREPPAGWQTDKFDDQIWKNAPGGFGTLGTPGARIGTLWTTRNIWLRRTVMLKTVPKKPALFIHHDEDAEVYVNGKRISTVKGFTTKYKVVPLGEEQSAALRSGKNLVAVHCRQSGGGQFIDVHLIDADNPPTLPQPKPPNSPFKSKLITRWGKKVTLKNVWAEYPRPQLVRKNWKNLNGQWDYAITSIEQQTMPVKWGGRILVPFCLESKLSGVQRLLHPNEALWYRRTIDAKPRAD